MDNFFSSPNQNQTSITMARRKFKRLYENADIVEKIKLKIWIYNCECNNNKGFSPNTFESFIINLKDIDYIQQIQDNMVDVSDIGTKESVINLILGK